MQIDSDKLRLQLVKLNIIEKSLGYECFRHTKLEI